MKPFFYLGLILIIISCADFKTKQDTEKGVTEADSIQIFQKPFEDNPDLPEYEIPLKKGTKIKHGIQKRFYRHGSLYSQIPYLNGKKVGIAFTYYPVVKGAEPVVWKEQPYINDTLSGICRRYHRNEKLQAEYEYKYGLPAIGLKEFTESGKTVKLPDLILTKSKTREYLYISANLTNKSKNVDYYLGGLVEGKYMPDGLKGLQVRDGIGEVLLPVNTKTITITAVYTTNYQNMHIVSKTIKF